MARYGWNLNNIPKRPYTAPPQIACRICNHVFMSTQALIDHIGTHMTDDDAQRRQKQQQPAVVVPAAGGGINLMSGQRNNHPFTIPSSSSSTALPFNLFSFGFPICHQERNPMFNPNPQIVPPRPAPQPYPTFMGMRNNFTVGSQQIHFPFHQAPWKAMEVTTSDSTKPFLQQLDKPFPYKPSENMRNKSDLDVMDLTLKL